MFLEWSIMGFVGIGTFMLLHALMSRRPISHAMRPPQGSNPGIRALQSLARLAGWITLVTLGVLVVTGWSGPWQAKPLTGYALMTHVAAGAVFALALAVWVMLRAGCYMGDEAKRSPCVLGWTQRFCFWGMVLLSLPLILSIALNLFPLFPQNGQHGLARCHRYAALGFVLTAWGYTYLVWHTEWRKTVSPHAPIVKENSCHS